MNESFFVSRLLETENLTDNLEDTEANRLLNWGVAQVGGLITNPLAAGERINGLMSILRQVNQLAPDLVGRSPQDIAAALADLAATYAQTFETAPPAALADPANLAAALADLPASQALDILLSYLTHEQGL